MEQKIAFEQIDQTKEFKTEATSRQIRNFREEDFVPPIVFGSILENKYEPH